MEKKILVGFIVAAMFLIVSTAQATLIDNGDYFTDDITGWSWYTAVDEFTGMNYATASLAVSNLTLEGLPWELASKADLETLHNYNVGDELLTSGLMNMTDTGEVMGWTSTVPTGKPGTHYWMSAETSFLTFESMAHAKDTDTLHNVGAFVVTKGSAPVPEPATMLLFGLGLLGLAGVNRRK